MRVVGFLTQKLTLRGTEVAIYDYAHYNETILGNKSIIMTKEFSENKDLKYISEEAYEHFKKRFLVLYYKTDQDIEECIEEYKIDVLYMLKSGLRQHDPFITKKCKCCIHAVFDTSDVHGDAFATISPMVNKLHNTNYPIVPHMVTIGNSQDNLRQELNIPEDATVFGRYGGNDSFDIYFVLEYIHYKSPPNTYFIFMNTTWFSGNHNIKYVEATTDLERKRKFINTADAMLHARARGETFGLACAEFALANKPVVTCGLSRERNHIDLLGSRALIYFDQQSLDFILKNIKPLIDIMKLDPNHNPYDQFSPNHVMQQFHQIFLKDL